VHLATSAPWWC